MCPSIPALEFAFRIVRLRRYTLLCYLHAFLLASFTPQVAGCLCVRVWGGARLTPFFAREHDKGEER